MSERAWRPLGVDTENEIAEYDALHDGLPEWMAAAFWAWVHGQITEVRSYSDGSGRVAMLNESLTEQMCQTLRIALPNLRMSYVDIANGKKQLSGAMSALREFPRPLQIADYLLAHTAGKQASSEFTDLLLRSNSAWTVGERLGLLGLVRRVAEGVQVSLDDVMVRAGQAGVRLAKAWGALYGLNPDPSHAYNLAIKAVEDAAIPVVSPTNRSATLGSVIAQMEQQGDWELPLDREHAKAPSGDSLIAMMRMLWHGQFDRHGGQPLVAGDVSFDEAQIAVGLAVTLVSWFDAKVPTRVGC